MASHSASTAKHATLAANVVDSVTFPRDLDTVEVLNRSASDIYFTVSGTAPTVGGDCYIAVAGGALAVVVQDNAASGGTVVKLISASSAAYSVSRAA